MFIQFIFALINYVFDLPYRQVELFRKAVKRDSIKQSSLEDHPVPLCVSANYPIVDGRFNIGPG